MSVIAVWQDLFGVITSFCLVSFAVWALIWTQRQRERRAATFRGSQAVAAALLMAAPLMLPDWLWLARGGWPAMLLAGSAAVTGGVAAVLLWYGLISAPAAAGRTGGPGDDLTNVSLAGELDEARRRLRELSEVSCDWVWQSDARGVLTYVSEGVRPVLGVGPEELVGRRLLDIGEAEAGTEDGGAGKRLVASRQVFRNLPLTCRHAGGESRLILLGGSPRFDPTGSFCGYSGVASDTTAERRLREARAAAQAKDSFFASMSHEIRTPLNGVLGILDIMRDTSLTEDQLRLVATAANSGESLLHLINDILDLSKIEAGRFEVTPETANLAQTVMLAVESVRSLASRNRTTIAVEGFSGVPELLEFDPHRYRQILLNFVSNAIKFTKDGSIRVRVEASKRTASSTIIRTSVVDTGPGISIENQKRLFLEFSKLHDPGSVNTGGTGLGLALSKRLAQAMGGDTGVVSEVGKGSTFWFEIAFVPSKVGSVKNAAPVVATAATSNRAAKTILLAEDNPTNVLVATRMLASDGHTIIHAANGQLAVDAFKQRPFDVILMDISMPVMDGVTAAREIRRIEATSGRQATPIVALTAHAIASEREKILAAGMSGFLTKPVRKKELLDEIARQGTGRSPARVEAPMPKANGPVAALAATAADPAAAKMGRTPKPVVSVLPGSIRPGLTKTGPTKPEPVKPDPIRPGPAMADAVRPDPVKLAPAKLDLVKPMSAMPLAATGSPAPAANAAQGNPIVAAKPPVPASVAVPARPVAVAPTKPVAAAQAVVSPKAVESSPAAAVAKPNDSRPNDSRKVPPRPTAAAAPPARPPVAISTATVTAPPTAKVLDMVKPVIAVGATPIPAVAAAKAVAPTVATTATTKATAPAPRAQTPAHALEVVLDRAVLRQLEEDAGEEAMPALIEIFVNEITKRSNELRRARSDTNVGLLKDTCHAIAGSSGTLGARRLYSLCKRVEEACLKRPDTKYLDIVPMILSEIDQLLRHLGASTASAAPVRASA